MKISSVKEYDNKEQNVGSRIKQMLLKRIFILQWLPTYTKMDGVADCIAGITLGLTMMPQSMAYATLANLPPQYGLYSAFMGSFIYVAFGTIKEVSIGPTSLMSILTLSIVRDLPIDFAVLLCFLAGCVEFCMGLLRLGFIVEFMSAPAVSGFTSATSVIIIMAQLKSLLGIKYNSDGLFEWAYKLYQNIPNILMPDTILGICCIIFLIAFKQLPKIKVKSEVSKKALWLISIGRNALIVLITSCLAAYFVHTRGKAPFQIYGTIVGGIPPFRPPNFSTKIGNETLNFIDMVRHLGTGIFTLPVVAVLANVAIAKAFAAGKVVDATQEMMTLGLCNIFGSFVQSVPTTGAFTRSAVSNASGIRTPMAGIYSGTIILLALTFLTPYFYYVPRATLAAVLISAVIFLIDYEIIPKLWRTNKFDLAITIITFIASIAYGVEFGLIFGALVNLIPLLKLWARPKIQWDAMTNQEGDGYIVFKPELGFFFPAVDHFSQTVVKVINNFNTFEISVIVIDCANILKMDYASALAFLNLVKALKKKSMKTKLINFNQEVYVILKSMLGEAELEACCTDTYKYPRKTSKLSVPNATDVEVPLLKT